MELSPVAAALRGILQPDWLALPTVRSGLANSWGPLGQDAWVAAVRELTDAGVAESSEGRLRLAPEPEPGDRATARTEAGGDPTGAIVGGTGADSGTTPVERSALVEGDADAPRKPRGPSRDRVALDAANAHIAELQRELTAASNERAATRDMSRRLGEAETEAQILRAGMRTATGCGALVSDQDLLVETLQLGLRPADHPAALPEGWTRTAHRSAGDYLGEVEGGVWSITASGTPFGADGRADDEAEAIRIVDAILSVLS